MSDGRRRTRPLFNRPYYMMIPATFLLVVLIAIPFLIGLYISLTRLNQYTIANWVRAPFIGLRNFVDGFTQGNALGASTLQSVWASVSFSLSTTLFITPIAVIAALVVNRPFKGRGLVRILFLLPYLMPVFVNAIAWRMIFMTGWGIVDRSLAFFHLGSRNTFWLLGPRSFWALVTADVWISWPFIYMLVLAGLQGIPDELYESASLDGASRIRSFFSITLPMLRNVLGLALLLSTLNHFNNFTLPFIMFSAPPPQWTDVLPVNVYITSFETFNFGLGAAMSLIALIIAMVPVVFYVRMLRLGEVAR